MSMADWIARLDAIIQLNGRELLTHAGKISHQLAMSKSGEEYENFKKLAQQRQREESLEELEKDLKQLSQANPSSRKPPKKKGPKS
jgi:hypothetical protein